ncbi:hypothetical protein [Bradyrhizobium sp.]|uniref:hypothetical protein n=1 Tax=Bradyrhizobium sp. TaxID=376 RepID=UPI001D703CE1|nr:hypothetical protein [Bradyrhizobium sp.]MBI5322070.1 hypothetical protein [Bradyrhizobium sp.]
MTVTPRSHPHALPVLGTAIAIVLLAILAVRLTGTPWQARPQPASQATVGVAADKAATRPKERVRYQATIDNWRRYRATTSTDAH